MAESTEASSPTFCSLMEERVEHFFLTRNELGTGRQHGILQGVKDGAMNFIQGSKDVMKWRKTKEVSAKGDSEYPELSSHNNFEAICKVVLGFLDSINKNFVKCADDKELQAIYQQLNKMEILISFHGVCNVGKSTILNAFLRKQVLPVDQKPETGVALHMCFSTTESGMQTSSAEGIILKENEVVIAKGTAPIKEKLKHINNFSRTKTCSDQSKKYSMFLECPFKHKITGGWKFTIADNPGSDEYGSDFIQSVLKESHAVSSAYFFILTIANCQNKESCNLLKALYKENKDIFQQGRLTIIVNKLDEALFPPPLEKSRTRDEVKAEVSKFLCEKVLDCSSDELPNKALVLMSGQWALTARLFQQSRMKEISSENHHSVIMDWEQQELEGHLQIVAFRFRKHPAHLKLEENDSDTLADFIEEQSGIKDFETRLEEVTMNLATLWKQKISENILQTADLFTDTLWKERDSLCKSIADIRTKVLEIVGVMDKMELLYSDIVHASNECNKTSDLWKAFEEACEEDIKGDEVKELCLKESLQKLDAFKVQMMEKINNSEVQPEEFRKDLRELKVDMTSAIDNYLSSRKYFKKAYAVYDRQYSEVFSTIMDTFKSAEKNLEHRLSIKYPVTRNNNLPVLTGPSLNFLSATSIPEGQPSLLELFLMALEKLLPTISDSSDPEDTSKPYVLDASNLPEAKDDNTDNVPHNGLASEDADIEVSETLQHASEIPVGAKVVTSDDILSSPDETDGAGEDSENSHKHNECTGNEEHMHSEQSKNSSDNGEDQLAPYSTSEGSANANQASEMTSSEEMTETLKSNEEMYDSLMCDSLMCDSLFPDLKQDIANSIRKEPSSLEPKQMYQKRHRFKRLSQVGYKRWSQELEKVIHDLKNIAQQEISGFFYDIGTNIVKVFCDHYQTEILVLLKVFDSNMKGILFKEKKRFNKMIRELQQLEERQQTCLNHIKSVKRLSEKFKSTVHELTCNPN